MRSFLFDEESGQGMVEYGLILALIAVVCIVGFSTLGNAANDKANNVAEEIGKNHTTAADAGTSKSGN